MKRALVIASLGAAAGCSLLTPLDDLGARQTDAAPEASNVPDAGSDGTAVQRCDVSKPFGTPVQVSALAGPNGEFAARLLPDELTVYFFRSEKDAKGNFFKILRAHRTSTSLPFDPPIQVNELNSVGSGTADPSPSGDGLTIYFESDRTDGGAPPPFFRLFVANRPNLNSVFGVPGLVMTTVAIQGVETYVLPDATALYYRDTSVVIRRAPITQGEVGTPVALTELSPNQELVGAPVPTNDELTIYYESNGTPSAQTASRIWAAHRTARSLPFGNAAPVLELSPGTANSDMPRWISSDGCHIYFDSTRPGTVPPYHIYYAEKPL